MPVAIAINIVLGVVVQQVMKLPIYLDSIGTILVGVLAGPIAGLVTGVLTNLIWQYAPAIGGGTIGPFAITAGGRSGRLATSVKNETRFVSASNVCISDHVSRKRRW